MYTHKRAVTYELGMLGIVMVHEKIADALQQYYFWRCISSSRQHRFVCSLISKQKNDPQGLAYMPMLVVLKDKPHV